MLTFTRRRERERELEQPEATEVAQVVEVSEVSEVLEAVVETTTPQEETEVVNEPSQVSAPEGPVKRKE